MRRFIASIVLALACTTGAWGQARVATRHADVLSTAPAQRSETAVNAGQSWSVLGRTPWRSSRITRPGFGAAVQGTGLADTTWIATADELGAAITFLPEAGTVVADGLVFAVGYTDADVSNDRVFAFDAEDGSVAWSAPIEIAVFDSWSTPAIDTTTGTVIVASGDEVAGIDITTGTRTWTATLNAPVVNASPVMTDDLGPADRVFITDYGFLSGTGRLYCINIDAFDATANPHMPGDLVWSVALGAPTSGNSPAYRDGVVYVPIAGPLSGAGAGGWVRAYAATATSTPVPLWAFEDQAGVGFFGGLTVMHDAVYVAGYGFGFGMDTGRLVKINRATGTRVWDIDANRTDSVPVVLPDGRVLLSGGYEPGLNQPPTGSVPSVALFRDHGEWVEPMWDTALATHTDANNNGIVDPGETAWRIGGWLTQPTAVRDGPGWYLLCAEPALPGEAVNASGIGPARSLVVIDLDQHPTDPNFVIAQRGGTGAAPAVVSRVIYSLGSDGLAAIDLGATGPGGLGGP